MAAEYPFPIPKAIENDLFNAIAKAGPPWQGLDEWSLEDDEPALFGFFNCWRGHTNALLEALKLVVNQCEPHGYENDLAQAKWEALAGSLYAIETRFVQFRGLLEWARLTWRHDPEIRRILSQDSDGPQGEVERHGGEA